MPGSGGSAFPARPGEELRDVRVCPWHRSVPCLLTNCALRDSVYTDAWQLA